MEKVIIENFICKHCGCKEYTHILIDKLTILCDHCGTEYEGKYIVEEVEEVKEEDMWNPENVDMKYIKAKNFVITWYEQEDKYKYFYIKDLLKQLRKHFKVTKKEFLEIILPQLRKEKKIDLKYCIGENSQTIRYTSIDGLRGRITMFKIFKQSN